MAKATTTRRDTVTSQGNRGLGFVEGLTRWGRSLQAGLGMVPPNLHPEQVAVDPRPEVSQKEGKR